MINLYFIGKGGVTSYKVEKHYVVSLPLLQSHPCLGEHTLIVYKAPGSGKYWLVAHLESGKRISEGETKTGAIAKAQDMIKLVDNETLKRKLDSSRDELQEAMLL